MRYTSHILDQLKASGFQQAIDVAISLGIDDLLIEPSKGWLVRDAEQQGSILKKHHHYGNVYAVEKLHQLIETWYATSEYLRQEMNPNFGMNDPSNPVHMMSFSGARGNTSQVHQLVGMRGLVSDPQGQIIDLPIQRNFCEGLSLTEYIISCYGTHKGVVDTVMQTSNVRYLTHRLVEVVQHIIVRRADCGTIREQVITEARARTSPSKEKVMKHIYSDLEGEMHWSTNVCHAPENVHAVHEEYLVIRSAKPYLATRRAVVHGHYGEFLDEGDTLITSIYERSKFGDIIQGLPKVEQLSEARSINLIPRNLEESFEDWNEDMTRSLGSLKGLFISARITMEQRDGMADVFSPGELIKLSRAQRMNHALEEETARVLAKATLRGRIDWLKGLKENVILGGIIPAGTGFKRFLRHSEERNKIDSRTGNKNLFNNKVKDIFSHHGKEIEGIARTTYDMIRYEQAISEISIHIINLAKTSRSLSEACDFVFDATGGIKYTTSLPDIVIIVDQQEEYTAIGECIILGIPTICLVDTDCDPDLIDVPIPANDDARASIRLISNKLTSAICEGRHSV
eukprot:Gb_09773 [translate_table: standard]